MGRQTKTFALRPGRSVAHRMILDEEPGCIEARTNNGVHVLASAVYLRGTGWGIVRGDRERSICSIEPNREAAIRALRVLVGQM